MLKTQIIGKSTIRRKMRSAGKVEKHIYQGINHATAAAVSSFKMLWQ